MEIYPKLFKTRNKETNRYFPVVPLLSLDLTRTIVIIVVIYNYPFIRLNINNDITSFHLKTLSLLWTDINSTVCCVSSRSGKFASFRGSKTRCLWKPAIAYRSHSPRCIRLTWLHCTDPDIASISVLSNVAN